MNLKSLRWLGAVSVLAAVVALGSVGGASANQKGGNLLPNCTPAKNVEAIIDDSGSTSYTDIDKFRTKLLDAFAGFGANNGKVFGGVEFGSSSDVLFGPATIPGVIPAMQASFAQVDANNGGTDFNLAFTAGNAHNGAADARIFLTDGQAPDPTTHANPKIKTYVVGLGDISTDPTSQTTLSKIAADTGGPAPFLVQDASQLQPVAGAITAAMNCKAAPITLSKTFVKPGQSFKIGFKATGKTADILITYPTSGAVIVPVLGGGGKKAGSSKVKLKVTRGATFSSAKIKGLKKKKKIKFKVKAKSLPAPTTATIQIIR